MQFSEQWLREYTNPAIDTEALSHLLTMAGLEVEGLESVGAEFTKVVIAEIISAEKHPDADRLQLLKVNIGAAEPLQIVCGASNARVGIKAPCALVGAVLPGFEIKQAKVRGVESFGMMCSEKELGLASESAGILELSLDAPIGQDIREFMGLNDKLFTLKLTPNRSDCLSLVGIAREVAALTGASLALPNAEAVKVTINDSKVVSVVDKEACAIYSGRLVQGVNAQANTPTWMVRRLERSGLHSISAIVDITNYVLLELGQPMHAFDAAKLSGDINVRWASQGEEIALLNQQSVKLDKDMLVIADHSGAIAFAGVMGGASTAVSDSTQDIFLESAFFTPDTIAGKGRRFGISTDSSYRFERGVDFSRTQQALERATALVVEICGGQAGPVTLVDGTLPVRVPTKLRMEKLNSILGITLEESLVAKLFDQLGFAYDLKAGVFDVSPPSYRFDIAREEDLIEEVARLYGYDNIPAVAPVADLRMLPDSEGRPARHVFQEALVANDYQEVVTYSFVDESWERDLLANANPIKIKNPIASNLSVMRSSIWGGLLDVLVYNLNRQQTRVRLFEIGATYHHAANSTYAETTSISGLAYGDALPEQWGEVARSVDFYDVKADVDNLTFGRATYVAAEHPALHPGQSAKVILDGKAIGWIGKLHPKWQQHYQLPKGVMLFELDFSALQQRTVPAYSEVSKFPPIRRDMAILVDEQVSAGELLNAMNVAKLDFVTEIGLFDVYRGKGIGENQKSLAFFVLMQDSQKSLVDADADKVMAGLLSIVMQQFGAQLR
ncbi:MAG: phenylalanine--tRNA ligase subunit beta [Methylophilaceae bacterium]|nr:phenylalanine--tRNA ligase subunit beta [Methylophilaceae bacterium]